MTPTQPLASSPVRPGSSPRRYLLVGLTAFAITVGLFYAEENWRGKRVWEKCKRELEATGQVLDWSAYIPGPVPEDQNIFKVPEIQQWFVKAPHSRPPSATWPQPSNIWNRIIILPVAEFFITTQETGRPATNELPLFSFDDPAARQQILGALDARVGPRAHGAQGFTLIAVPANQIQSTGICLRAARPLTAKELSRAWPEFGVRPKGSNIFTATLGSAIGAADYLDATAPAESDLEMLRQALTRPFARMDGDYQRPFFVPIQNFVNLRTVAQTLGQRAQCFLLLRQPQKALRELTLLHQLGRLLDNAPGNRAITLVSAMIDVAIKGVYLSTVKDGLRLGVWGDAELAAIQEQLQEIDKIPLFADALKAEMAAVCRTFETTSRAEWQKIFTFGSGSDSNSKLSIYTLLPRGWIYQMMAVYARLMQQQIAAIDPSNRLIHPSKMEQATDAIVHAVSEFSPYNIIAKVAIPNATKAARTLARIQTTANQTEIVCALERYRQARGEYPDKLETLIPRFTPRIRHDIIGGRQPNYRPTSDGKFRLYSIGWDEKDHGGDTPADSKGGDFVWDSHLGP